MVLSLILKLKLALFLFSEEQVSLEDTLSSQLLHKDTNKQKTWERERERERGFETRQSPLTSLDKWDETTHHHHPMPWWKSTKFHSPESNTLWSPICFLFATTKRFLLEWRKWRFLLTRVIPSHETFTKQRSFWMSTVDLASLFAMDSNLGEKCNKSMKEKKEESGDYRTNKRINWLLKYIMTWF